MEIWIAAWVFVFAGGLLVAILANGRSWREHLPEIGLMLFIMAGSGYLFLSS